MPGDRSHLINAYQPDGYLGCPPCRDLDCCGIKKKKCSYGCWTPCKKGKKYDGYKDDHYDGYDGYDSYGGYGKCCGYGGGYGGYGKCCGYGGGYGGYGGYDGYGKCCGYGSYGGYGKYCGYGYGYDYDYGYGKYGYGACTGGCGGCRLCKTGCYVNPFWEISGTDRCLPGTPAAKLHKSLGHNLARRTGQQYLPKITYSGVYGSYT